MDPKLTLTITFDQQTGQVQISGPVNNPLTCLGILELAKACLLRPAAAAERPMILPAALNNGGLSARK